MTESIPTSDGSALNFVERLQELEAAAARRNHAEEAYAARFVSGTDPRQESLARDLAEIVDRHTQAAAVLTDEFDQRHRQVESEYHSQQQALKSEHDAAVSRARREAQQETDRVNRQHEDSRWVATSVLDETAEESPKRQYERIRASLEKTYEQQQAECAALDAEILEIVDSRGWSTGPLPPPETGAVDLETFSAEFTHATERARERLAAFRNLPLSKLFVGMRSWGVLALLIAAIGIVVFLFVPPSVAGITADRGGVLWFAISVGGAVVVSLLLLTVLYTVASTQISDAFAQLQQHASNARYFHGQWSQRAEQEKRQRQREFETLREQREQQLAIQLERYEAAHQQSLADIDARRRSTIDALTADYAARVQSLDRDRDRQLAEIDQQRKQQLAELARTFEQDRDARQAELDRSVAERERQRQQDWDRLATAWFEQVGAFGDFATEAQHDSGRRNLDWSTLAGPGWDPPREIPHGIRIGEFTIDLAQIEGGISSMQELVPPVSTFRVPSLLPFPKSPSLLLETKGHEGRREALQAMQVALLRMLTQVPPGKLRLTVIDPIGLGESFSGLMHLADFDELLITSRIWTEMGHIESRLAELTEHMENVLQKYLRNEFATIEEYNQFAGEVAEPYRVLVVADFPNKFSEQAARRLMSIAASGPRCGVYLLMSADRTAQMPNTFDLPGIEAAANTFVWRSGGRASDAPPSSSWFPNSVWEHPPRNSVSRAAEHEAELIDDPDSLAGPGLRSQTEFGNEGKRSERHQAFYSQSHELSRWTLILDTPPAPEVFTQIVKNVGEASKDIRRVEVSFSRIAPKPEEVWTRDSRSGIDIPLGRAGATKLQHLRLGQGTSQHMLVAGKTGSGKSTFFHTLITNVAMYYSPAEIELYLVDFKKGVEFKAYAPPDTPHNAPRDENRPTFSPGASTLRSPESDDQRQLMSATLDSRLSTLDSGLPHARVIAIESDREFGVSVLQRLDAVLNERGELFRRAGVQDIAGYRNRVLSPESSVQWATSSGTLDSRLSTLHSPLPRILLIIDEFQEFFVEDDRYAQQAALLLDRLVRQGRAFGVHVILGSQTLGGAYSLARSTLGQVAVRVALQCSETDAHLILSEENTAARLLTRPGEAIYNDANGLVEGNHPFQIAWLPEEERAGYLAVMQHFQQERGIATKPPIVFEGNIPSDPARNAELMSLISSRAGGWPGLDQREAPDRAASPPPRIWLGESVDIGPPTSITFPPQAGANVLIVGSDSGAATGILATSLIALASSPRAATRGLAEDNDSPRFYIFDGSPPGSPEADLWRQLAEIIPDALRLVTPQTAPHAIAELTAERRRRDAALGESHQPLFIVVAGVSKFRDLRKTEDDFSLSGFGSSNHDAAPDLGRQFADLLANGPALGLHTLLWSDSYGNVERWLSRQSLREFELRITFPMNATDSSNLIDSPAASRLGVHRALLYREDTGTATKFRPYGPPSAAWLAHIRSALATPRPLEVATDLAGFRVT
ncbi:MAG: FtsK/SpoIIIE domain-containing protein [Planctomycetaceae bacterium]